MLQTKLEAQNYTFKQAVEDADTLIVQTAIELASSFSSVCVIGEDVDLLVLLTAKAREIPNVYFRKPGRGNKEDEFYSPQSFQYNDSIAKCILFVHAFSGCDTTSALFNQGKIRFLKTLEKNPTLTEAIQVFDDPNAELTEVVAAGELFMLRQYGAGSKHRTLDSLRYTNFVRAVSKNSFNLASLPPTSDACHHHSLRTYCQVQSRRGVQKPPEDHGWRKTTTGLDAIRISKEPAPEVLLKSISCRCQKGCGPACGCRKAGLKCSVLCLHCTGTSCENILDQIVLDDDNAEDAENVSDQIQDDEDQTDNAELAEYGAGHKVK